MNAFAMEYNFFRMILIVDAQLSKMNFVIHCKTSIRGNKLCHHSFSRCENIIHISSLASRAFNILEKQIFFIYFSILDQNVFLTRRWVQSNWIVLSYFQCFPTRMRFVKGQRRMTAWKSFKHFTPSKFQFSPSDISYYLRFWFAKGNNKT